MKILKRAVLRPHANLPGFLNSPGRYSSLGADGSAHLALIIIAAAILVGTTVNLGLSDTWFDDQRWLAAGALALAGLVSMACRQPCSLAQSLLLGVGLLGALSASLAPRPEVAAAEWALLVAAASVVALAAPLRNGRVVQLMAWASAAIAAAYSTGVLANYVAALWLGLPVGADTFLVGFSNPRFAAQLEALTLPFLPLAYRAAPSRFWRSTVALVAALWWMCLIGSGSRTAWIALLAAAIVALAFPAGRVWLRTQLLVVAIGAALFALLFIAMPVWLAAPAMLEVDRFENFSSVSARWKLAAIALDAVRTSPWLGVGPMHFAYSYNGEGAHPHNVWLQLAAEWGAPASALIAVLALGLWLRLWALTWSASNSGQDARVAVLCALTVWGVGSLADGYIVVPTSLLASVAVLMLASGLVRGGRSLDVERSWPAGLITWGWRLVVVAACLVLLRLPSTGFGDPVARERIWRTEHPGEWAWPRFWQQGWIGPDRDPSAR